MYLVPFHSLAARLWLRARAALDRALLPAAAAPEAVAVAIPAAAPPTLAVAELGPAETPAGMPFVHDLKVFQARLEDLIAPLKSRPRFVRRGPERKWKVWMPRLSRTCADVMDYARVLFKDFSFAGPELRGLEEEVRQIGVFLSFMARSTKEVAVLYLERKAELCEKTMQVVEQVQAQARMPVPAPELKELVKDANVLIDGVLRPNLAALRRRRAQKARLHQEGEQATEAVAAELRAAELERRILRGERIDAADVAAARGAPPR